MAWHFAASGGWAKDRFSCGECCRSSGTRLRPRQYNCLNHPADYDHLSKERWWTAEYQPEKGEPYYPDDFRWPECPVSTLSQQREGFDPVGMVEMIGEARRVGGKGAVFALTRRDARLYDAAAVIEQCRNAEHAAAMKAMQRKD